MTSSFPSSDALAKDSIVYNRNYLDCWRRQSVVMLKHRGFEVDWLFCEALDPVPHILEQMVTSQNPKFSFDTKILSPKNADLLSIGMQTNECDGFENAMIHSAEWTTEHGFFILFGDCFYMPHREQAYKILHINHSIIICGENDGEITIVDDSSESILTKYKYSREIIQDFFNNNIINKTRVFTGKTFDRQAVIVEARDRFIAAAQLVISKKNELELFTEVDQIAGHKYESLSIRARKLQDSFSVYSGSRLLTARYLKHAYGDSELTDSLLTCAEIGATLKNYLIKAEMRGNLNIDDLVGSCRSALIHELRLHNLLARHVELALG